MCQPDQTTPVLTTPCTHLSPGLCFGCFFPQAAVFAGQNFTGYLRLSLHITFQKLPFLLRLLTSWLV